MEHVKTALIILAVVSGMTLIGSLGWPQIRKIRRLSRLRSRPRYRKAAAFLSDVERDMLKALKDMVGAGLIVYPNVRLYDLLELAGGSEENNLELAARLRSEIVDFAVCDARSSAPMLVVEMRGGEKNDDILERNRFVEGVLASAGLPVLPISKQSPHTSLELAEAVHTSLSDYIRKASAAA